MATARVLIVVLLLLVCSSFALGAEKHVTVAGAGTWRQQP
jgi:hypothetical protein